MSIDIRLTLPREDGELRVQISEDDVPQIVRIWSGGARPAIGLSFHAKELDLIVSALSRVRCVLLGAPQAGEGAVATARAAGLTTGEEAGVKSKRRHRGRTRT